MKDVLLVEKKESVCTLSLNRPENQNGLNIELMQCLTKEMKSINIDPDTRVVILKGSGNTVFSTGMDLASEVAKGKAPGELPSDIDSYTPVIRSMMNRIMDCRSNT